MSDEIKTLEQKLIFVKKSLGELGYTKEMIQKFIYRIFQDKEAAEKAAEIKEERQ
jgi:hypothetical protein